MNWSERGLLAMQKGFGNNVKYDSQIAKIMADAHHYGNSVGNALKAPDATASQKAEEQWNSLPIEARAACRLTEAQAKLELAKGRQIF